MLESDPIAVTEKTTPNLYVCLPARRAGSHSKPVVRAAFYRATNGKVRHKHITSGVAGSQVRLRSVPYGEYRTTPTADLTDVGFTGHRQTDLGLIYMRARYYVQSVGRFASADSIIPEPGNPQSHNRFSYTLGNPINLTDPTGYCTAEDYSDTGTRGEICRAFLGNGILFDGAYWETDQLSTLFNAMWRMIGFLGLDRFQSITHGTPNGVVTLVKLGGNIRSANFPGRIAGARAFDDEILFSKRAFDPDQKLDWIFVHEFAHIWDQGQVLSEQFQRLTGGEWVEYLTGSFPRPGTSRPELYVYDAGPPSLALSEGSPTAYGNTNPLEDFADSFLVRLYSARTDKRHALNSDRENFFNLAVYYGPISTGELVTWLSQLP